MDNSQEISEHSEGGETISSAIGIGGKVIGLATDVQDMVESIRNNPEADVNTAAVAAALGALYDPDTLHAEGDVATRTLLLAAMMETIITQTLAPAR